MADFFISYTATDKNWAEWIGWHLEEAGYSVIVQAWDFRPGNNFVLQMDEACRSAQKLIAVLSENYFKSGFTPPEWAAYFVKDPTSKHQNLIPVRVQSMQVQGILKGIVYIDLVNTNENQAKELLLNGIKQGRAKPTIAPSFPGHNTAHNAVLQKPEFPTESIKPEGPYIPQIKRALTPLDKNKFMKDTFQSITSYFVSGLKALSSSNTDIDTEFQPINEISFLAQVYVSGTEKCKCKIWLNKNYSGLTEIAYSDSFFSLNDTSMNEVLCMSKDQNSLKLMAILSGHFNSNTGLDPRSLTSQESAEWLWRKFVSPLER